MWAIVSKMFDNSKTRQNGPAALAAATSPGMSNQMPRLILCVRQGHMGRDQDAGEFSPAGWGAGQGCLSLRDSSL